MKDFRGRATFSEEPVKNIQTAFVGTDPHNRFLRTKVPTQSEEGWTTKPRCPGCPWPSSDGTSPSHCLWSVMKPEWKHRNTSIASSTISCPHLQSVAAPPVLKLQRLAARGFYTCLNSPWMFCQVPAERSASPPSCRHVWENSSCGGSA